MLSWSGQTLFHAALIATATGAFVGSVSVLAASASTKRTSQNPCSVGVTRAVVTRLVAALNEGDVDLADQLVAKGDAFKWYSVGRDRIGQAARNRSSLKAYFAARHAQGETLRLLRLRIGGVYRAAVRGGTHWHARFSLVVIRSARDYPSARVPGKGATDCTLRPPEVAVWSLGSGTPIRSPFCSRPSLTALSPSRPSRRGCLVAQRTEVVLTSPPPRVIFPHTGPTRRPPLMLDSNRASRG